MKELKLKFGENELALKETNLNGDQALWCQTKYDDFVVDNESAEKLYEYLKSFLKK
jgi:hypothetical protein